MTSWKDELTPTYYKLRHILLERQDDGDVTATFEVSLHGANGQGLGHVTKTITLTQGQTDTLKTFAVSKLNAFEAETGLQPLSQMY